MNNLPRGDVINTISSGAAPRVPFGQRVGDEEGNTRIGDTAAIEENRVLGPYRFGDGRGHGGWLSSRWRSNPCLEKGRAVGSEAQCHVVILYEHPLLGERIMPMN